MKTAIVSQHVDEHSQQHVHDVVHRFHSRDRGPAGGAGPEFARHFLEAEAPALEHDERFDLRIFQRKTAAEQLQRAPVDADEAAGWVVYRASEDRPQYGAEEANAE